MALLMVPVTTYDHSTTTLHVLAHTTSKDFNDSSLSRRYSSIVLGETTELSKKCTYTEKTIDCVITHCYGAHLLEYVYGNHDK